MPEFESGKGYNGIQVRDLKEVLRANQKAGSTIGILRLKNNPMRPKVRMRRYLASSEGLTMVMLLTELDNLAWFRIQQYLCAQQLYAESTIRDVHLVQQMARACCRAGCATQIYACAAISESRDHSVAKSSENSAHTPLWSGIACASLLSDAGVAASLRNGLAGQPLEWRSCSEQCS